MKKYFLLPSVVLEIIVSYYIWSHSPEYIKKGGPLLVVGLLAFFLAATFCIERTLVLLRAGGRSNVDKFIKNIMATIPHGSIDEAVDSCKRQGGCLANVVGAGLMQYQAMADAVTNRRDLLQETRRAMQEANALETPHLERNLTVLSTIASIATLLGLLGTTIGMIRSFKAMSNAGAPDATQLALGISEALVNTALGLITAVIATVMYNYFTTRVDKFGNMMEETSHAVMLLLRQRKGT
jgi:biopolymer transport protein ExbB